MDLALIHLASFIFQVFILSMHANLLRTKEKKVDNQEMYKIYKIIMCSKEEEEEKRMIILINQKYNHAF